MGQQGMNILRLASQEMPLDCIASVVLYKNPQAMIKNVVRSFLDTSLIVKLYIIDNSPTPLHQSILEGAPVFLSPRGTEYRLRQSA